MRSRLTDNLRMTEKRTASTPNGDLSQVQLGPVLGYQIAQASVTTSRIYDLAAGTTTGLHRLEYSILMLVRENPDCTASSLAKALGISAPNMALWLDRVTGRGLVDRKPSTRDRRSNHLRLSHKGEQTVVRATQAILKIENAVLSHLSAGERAILTELLLKVAACRKFVDALRSD